MSNHLSALLRKNWILWKRNLCCSCCELILPTLLIFALIGIRSAVEIQDVPYTSYITKPPMAGGPVTIPADLTNYTQANDSRDRMRLPPMLECIERGGEPVKSGGNIAISPANDSLMQKIGGYIDKYGYTVSYFNSLDDIDSYIEASDYGSTSKPYLCFAVSMMQHDKINHQYKYYLAYNTSGRVGTWKVPRTDDPRTNPIRTENLESQVLWQTSGWLSIQNWIDNLIIREATNDDSIAITVHEGTAAIPKHISDEFPSFMTGQFGIYLVLPLMIIYLRMTFAILYEKEKKLREGMKMMGLQNTSFYLSWIITYLIIYTIISIIATILLRINVFPHTSGATLFFLYWLFCMVLLFQSLFITVFFTRALFGLIVAILFYLMMFLVISIVNSSATPTTSSYWAASISSQAALSFAFDVMISFESQGVGVDSNSVDTYISNYSVSMAITMHVLNIIFYSVMAIYLDQIFPNEWGKKKHPLFFLQCGKRKSAKIDKQLARQISAGKADRMEQVDALLDEQETRNEILSIKELFKVYPNGKKAVNDLNLKIYQNQIFVLLGHNGAGKTTTISMLTGMLDISSGSATVFGKDIESDLEEIRKFMGVCPQHDILFDDLTVKEHLVMFANFKGMKTDNIEADVKKIIEDVDLAEKTDYLVKNLSGGQKRRLSVAIAFIGGSKLIYLDEPTSGMDTSARRYIWEMLKNYKNERIVVLTTHFMDEADFLGDRIGIMGEGKLICCGSSVFLKNKFGVGYNLTIVKQDTNVDSLPIINLLQDKIPESEILSNVSAEVAFQLPMTAVDKFPALFDELDAKLKELKIETYGISITTLEEVFLKVAQLGAGHKQVDEYMKDEEKNQELVKIDDFDMNKIRITSDVVLFLTHTAVLLQKRMRYFKRDLRSLCCEIFLPCVVVVCGLGLMSISFVNNESALLITANNFAFSNATVYWGGQKEGKDYFNDFDIPPWDVKKFTNITATTKKQIALQAENEYYQKYDLREGVGYYYVQQAAQNIIEYYMLGNSVQTEALPLMMNQMNQAILREKINDKEASIQVYNRPLRVTKSQLTTQNTVSGFIGAFIFSIGMSFIPASVISYIVKEREIAIKHQQLVCGVSVKAYWFSNFVMDVGKHIIPAIFCSLMVLAFSLSALYDDGNYGVTWLLFFLYGWAIIPFCYLTSFLFQKQGNALLLNFFFHLICGALVSLIIWVLRLIKSTRTASKVLVWFLRLIPSFSFATGILNMANRALFAKSEGYSQLKDAYDLDISGGDILMLSLEGVIYMGLVLLVEALEDNGSLAKIGSKELTIPYQPKQLDDDVVKEAQTVKTLDPSTQAILVDDMRKVFMLGKGKYKVAVDQVSFSVGNGEVFGLLGVNGAGKTTTFKMLSGEIKPTSGRAFIAGFDIINNMAEARRNIGYCPQFDALLENITVEEHLELFTIIKGIPNALKNELVNKKLAEMDLERFRHIEAGQLSGGNKRKLSVAIAMIGNPPIVFLDEPSTGMDPEARRFMWNVISRIATQRKQSSIVLTTHSMEEAEALSTKVAIQVEGNLRCIGSVQHIKNKYGQGYELEIKLNNPPKEIIYKMISDLNITSKFIDATQANDILSRLGVPHLIKELSPKGYGSQLFVSLYKTTSGLSIEALLEFVCTENVGALLMSFIEKELGPNEIIEHFQTFYRFRLKSNISVGKIFGAFQKNKDQLQISQYSIKQASIEQIFNQFAVQQMELEEANHHQVKPQVAYEPIVNTVVQVSN